MMAGEECCRGDLEGSIGYRRSVRHCVWSEERNSIYIVGVN